MRKFIEIAVVSYFVITRVVMSARFRRNNLSLGLSYCAQGTCAIYEY